MSQMENIIVQRNGPLQFAAVDTVRH